MAAEIMIYFPLPGEIRTSENSYFCQAARQLSSVPSSQLCVKLASGGDPTYAFNIRFTGEEVHGTSKWFLGWVQMYRLGWGGGRTEIQGVPCWLEEMSQTNRSGGTILSYQSFGGLRQEGASQVEDHFGVIE